jgi:hypothetical protein
MIIENFYEEEIFKKIFNLINTDYPFLKTYQPQTWKNINRMDGYPCYETDILTPENFIFKEFVKTFQEKTLFKIKLLKTLIRKTYKNELLEGRKNKKIFKPHQDEGFDLAGVIYFNSKHLNDGTVIFSNQKPSIIVGSQPNRCVYYNCLQWHQPNIFQELDVRIIQPFFITLIK